MDKWYQFWTLQFIDDQQSYGHMWDHPGGHIQEGRGLQKRSLRRNSQVDSRKKWDPRVSERRIGESVRKEGWGHKCSRDLQEGRAENALWNDKEVSVWALGAVRDSWVASLAVFSERRVVGRELGEPTRNPGCSQFGVIRPKTQKETFQNNFSVPRIFPVPCNGLRLQRLYTVMVNYWVSE